jgi:hypothetical protein
MKKTVSMILGVLLVGSGCTIRVIDFTAISTKNVDWSQASSFERTPTRATGEDKTPIIIFIPIGAPNIKQAVDRAIESVPGAVALVDGVISVYQWYIPFIYGETSYIAEGTPLINPALRAAPGARAPSAPR